MPDSLTPAPIPFIDLVAQKDRIAEQIETAIAGVLDHGRYIMGPEVARFESDLSAFCGAAHAIGVANGTDALSLALMALELKAGEAVLVPSFTFAATAEAVAALGAVPIFVDVLEDSFNTDPAGLHAGLDRARREGLTVRGLIAVDLFGQPADYPAIEAFCADNGLWLVVDAAQSFGAELAGRASATIGDICTTSFFPAKPLGCYGDGGAVFTGNDRLAAILRSLQVHGKGSDKYDNVRVGMNSRLDTLQAAILIEKLAIFAQEIEARNRVAARYAEGLGAEGLGAEGLDTCVAVPTLIQGARSVWAQYTIRIGGRIGGRAEGRIGGERDAVAAALKAQGIPTAIYYPMPLHEQTAYADFPVAGNGLPVSERLSRQVLSLPMHPYLSESDQDRVIAAVRAAVAPG